MTTLPIGGRGAALIVRLATGVGLRRWAYRHVYLRSRGWAEFASVVRKRQGGRCASCGRRARLEVHHRHYATLGREKRSDVVGLCTVCHLRRHGGV